MNLHETILYNHPVSSDIPFVIELNGSHLILFAIYLSKYLKWFEFSYLFELNEIVSSFI